MLGLGLADLSVDMPRTSAQIISMAAVTVREGSSLFRWSDMFKQTKGGKPQVGVNLS